MYMNKGQKHNPQLDPCGLKADIGPDCLWWPQESVSTSRGEPPGSQEAWCSDSCGAAGQACLGAL